MTTALTDAIAQTLTLVRTDAGLGHLSTLLTETQGRLEAALTREPGFSEYSDREETVDFTRDALHGATAQIALATVACLAGGSPGTARKVLQSITSDDLHRSATRIESSFRPDICLLGFFHRYPNPSSECVLAMILGALARVSPEASLSVEASADAVVPLDADALEAICSPENSRMVAEALHRECEDGNPLPFLKLLQKLLRQGYLSRPAMDALLGCAQMIKAPYLYQEIGPLIDWNGLIAKSRDDSRALRTFWEFQAVAPDRSSIGKAIDQLLGMSGEQDMSSALTTAKQRGSGVKLRVGASSTAPVHLKFADVMAEIERSAANGVTLGSLWAHSQHTAAEDERDNGIAWSGDGVQRWERIDFKCGLEIVMDSLFSSPPDETAAGVLKSLLTALLAHGDSTVIKPGSGEEALMKLLEQRRIGIVTYRLQLDWLNRKRMHLLKDGKKSRSAVQAIDAAIETLLGLSFQPYSDFDPRTLDAGPTSQGG